MKISGERTFQGEETGLGLKSFFYANYQVVTPRE
jgi:hypothetical protein